MIKRKNDSSEFKENVILDDESIQSLYDSMRTIIYKTIKDYFDNHKYESYIDGRVISQKGETDFYIVEDLVDKIQWTVENLTYKKQLYPGDLVRLYCTGTLNEVKHIGKVMYTTHKDEEADINECQ